MKTIETQFNEELFYSVLPEAKEAGLSIQDVRNILKPIIEILNRRKSPKTIPISINDVMSL